MKITAELLEEFLNFYRNQNFKKDTVRGYELEMERFFQYLKTLKIDDTDLINMKIIDQYRTLLANQKTTKNSIYYGLQEKLSPRTIQTKIQPIKRFLEFLNVMYNTGLNYLYIKCPKVYSKHMDFFEKDEIEKILKVIEEKEQSELARLRMKLFVVCAFVSWWRISELRQIKVQDICNWRAIIRWKWDKTRELFFNQHCINILNEYLEARKGPLPSTWKVWENHCTEDRAFISHNPDTFWNQVSVTTLCECNKKVNDRIDLWGKKFSAHTLRHSAATYMLDNKANLREIQEFLWHSYLTTTQTYTHLRNNQVYETQQKIFWDF